jgi:hypothetical protein
MVWIDEPVFIFADESSVPLLVPLRDLFLHDDLDPALTKDRSFRETCCASRLRNTLTSSSNR